MRSHTQRFSVNRVPLEHQPIPRGAVLAEKIRRLAAPTVLALFCLCFVIGALRASANSYLWMDEVLSVWAARLPTVGLVWSAVFRGSEASPPGYQLLLHGLIKAGGGSYMLLRLPSILGAFISSLCVFALLRKYLDSAAGAYGMAFSLLGVLAWYAVEARPYTLVTACFAVAFLLWDGFKWQNVQIWRTAAISFLLIAAICLHFYAVLLVPCMAAMELLWSALNRRVRVSMWTALFIAGASSFLWLPLIRAHSRFIAGEVGSTRFYAKVTPARLLKTYEDLIIHDKKQAVFIAATFAAIFAASALQGIQALRKRDDESRTPRRSDSNLFVIGLCTVLFPVLVFIFAFFVTKTFNTRYTLIGALGFSLAAAYTISRVRAPRAAAYTLVLAGCALALLSGAPPEGVKIGDQLSVLSKASVSSYSIVIPDGRLYFELAEAAPPSLKSRLVYVDLPPGANSDLDPTNEHHVDRWHQIRPDLRVMSAKEFFAHNPRFYVFHTSASIYVITDWLLNRNLIGRPIAENEDAWLFEAKAPEPGNGGTDAFPSK